MIQRHFIILWKKAERKDKTFEEIAKEAYRVLFLFQDFPQALRPNYLTAKNKKESKAFDWNYENFSHMLKKGINKESEKTFENLGYSLSFFSCMDEQDSCAFQITAGNKNEKFYNALIIDLPLSLNLYDERTAEKIRELFEKLVEEYSPYWGCISNRALSRKYGKFLEGGLPTTIHWMNYWSEDIVRSISMEKILAAMNKYPLFSFHKGILSMKNTPFDVEKEEDISYHNELQKAIIL